MIHLLTLFAAEKQQPGKPKGATQNGPIKPDLTWVHDIFQGTLTNETRCLNCETVGVST